ncbi:MAG: ATP-binding protein [Muribaculaceae bacterium]|nr:ATP-binding protein [Muribaculaceae bacterium]
MDTQLLYPVGIQDFPRIREREMVYIDKTALVYRLANEGECYFLSRPRRFGKSLLISTLEAYFQGRKELFHGLAIERLEKDWTEHPVLRLDMSRDKYATTANLLSMLDGMLSFYECQYDITPPNGSSPGTRLNRLIETAHKQTGKPVVVLVDEYDAPMLDSQGNPALQAEIRNIVRGFYSPLKAQAARLRFVFLTGITKFSQLSIFSELNNLRNISMLPQYEALCGITAEEMVTQMRPGIECLAEHHGCTFDEMVERLKMNYDGYHFGRRLVDVYNPFSLVNVLQDSELGQYWFASGTPTWLLELLGGKDIELDELEHIEAPASRFDQPTEQVDDPIPVLYQSGYLTIKDYDPDSELYTLGIPNREVRIGLGDSLVKYVKARPGSNDYLRKVYFQLRRGTATLADFMAKLKDFYSAIPYDVANDNERHYQAILYAVLASFGTDVRVEERTAAGRADLVLLMPQEIYVMELKYGHTVQEAMEQLRARDYAAKWRHDGSPVRLLAINISKETRTVDDWACKPGIYIHGGTKVVK